MKNVIVTYEDWKGGQPSFPSWLTRLAIRKGTPAPTSAETQGEVRAVINQGRWLVECPGGCGGAVVVSLIHPIFFCPYCGSPEHGDKWYQIIFPKNREAIEAILLRRPARNPFYAVNRNWTTESVKRLQGENVEHGLEVP